MKRLSLITMIMLVLTIAETILLAQSDEMRLDQAELLKQKLGSWKCELGGDTILYTDLMPCLDGFESNIRYSIHGKVLKSGKELYGYDKISNKILLTCLTEGAGCELHEMWFTTRNNFYIIPHDPVDSHKKSWRIIGHIITSDRHTLTTIVDRRPIKKLTFTRLK